MSFTPKNFNEYETSYRGFLKELSAASPTLREACHLKGSAPISLQFLKHTFSMDGDFMTDSAFDSESVGLVASELKEALGPKMNICQQNDEYGLLHANIECNDGATMEFQLLAGIEDFYPNMGSGSGDLEGFKCQSLEAYLHEKVTGCLPHRSEPKDLYHIGVACCVSDRIDGYVRHQVEEMSEDPDLRESLIFHFQENDKEFDDPGQQLSELASPRAGKTVISLEHAKEFNHDLLLIAQSKEVERPEPSDLISITHNENLSY